MIDKQAILATFNRYFSNNGQVTVDDQGLVSVTGDCTLGHLNRVTQLPVQFASVGGYFSCSDNRLTSLAGAPQSVGGYFSCSGNELTSLDGAPQSVGGYFDCYHNQLTSLAGAPQSVGGDFYCSGNKLTSLAGAPQSVGGYFYCSGNKLTSLDGIPKSINGEFNLGYIPNLPMLRLFKVRDITKALVIDSATRKQGHPVEHIINRYIHLGINGILPCAAELYKAGYSGNAKL